MICLVHLRIVLHVIHLFGEFHVMFHVDVFVLCLLHIAKAKWAHGFMLFDMTFEPGCWMPVMPTLTGHVLLGVCSNLCNRL